MKKSNFQERSKLPEDHIRVAERLRAVRAQERFSQHELAREVGQERTAIANYEYGRARIPLALGLDICRRLDLNPRWLVSGQEPQRPFVPLTELGINEKQFQRVSAHSTDIVDGYRQFLAESMEKWLAENPPDKIISRIMEGGPAAVARRLSLTQLEAEIARFAVSIRDTPPEQKIAIITVLDVFSAELRARLETNFPRRGVPK